MNTVLLSNIEYDHLYNEGGDGLVAFFATLRFHKCGIVFKKKGRSGMVGTIRAHTGLSHRILTKTPYLNKLRDMGYLKAHKNGNVALTSRRFNRKRIKSKCKNYKLLPIEVHKRFTDTKYSSLYVRIHSSVKNQRKAIQRKSERLKILKRVADGKAENMKDVRIAKKLCKKADSGNGYGSALDYHYKNLRSTETLSNQGFSKLKGVQHKSQGYRIKQKFIKMGLLYQKRSKRLFLNREFKKSDVNHLKNVHDTNSLVFYAGKIYREVSPDISLCLLDLQDLTEKNSLFRR